MNKPNIYIVIPTIRELSFLEKWKYKINNCHLIVVEDHKKPELIIPKYNFLSVHHFSWNDIDQDLGKNSWIISRQNAGIRCYGFLKAIKMGADVVITLDDDCYPTNDEFINGHLNNLSFKQPEKWINTYPHPKWMYTRGFPYSDRQTNKTFLSHGLWSGALDLDAKVETKMKKLLNEKKYPLIRQIIPPDSYYPMCSMNLAFKKEIAVLMFFPMMGISPSGKAWPYDRFDDIWAGVFSKKIMDHLGMRVISGSPFVEHKKASLPSLNYIKELSGMEINEELWKRVDKVRLTSKNPKDCYIELATKVNFPSNSYFKNLKDAMIIWAKLF